MKNFDERLEYLNDGGEMKLISWYTPKQNWNIGNICYGIKVLESYQTELLQDENLNFDKFYEEEINKYKEKLTLNNMKNRIINSGAYLGLLTTVNGRAKTNEITERFYEIERKSRGEFEKLDRYYDDFEIQTEKMFLNRAGDNPNALIHPLIVLYKVLLLLYEYTEEYRISFDEFYAFVYFIEKYEDIYICVEDILRTRISSYESMREISKERKKYVRLKSLYEQMRTLEVTHTNISLKHDYINQVKNKVREYELNIKDRINHENLLEALLSPDNLFEFFRRV